jgi:PAS domain S-box-containing protein
MSSAAVIMTDTEGCISYWNAGAESLLGYSALAAMGQSLDLIVPIEHREAHWRGFHRAMDQPQIKDLASDLPLLCADGTNRHFAGRLLVLMDALGKAIGAVAIFTDRGEVGFRAFG